MADNQSLREYYKYCVFAFIFGFGGTVWGGLTYFLGIPVAYMKFLGASATKVGLISAIFWLGFAVPQVWAAYKSESMTIKKNFIIWSISLSSIGFLVAGIFILIAGTANPAKSIWVFLLCYTWAAVIGGLYIPANFAMLFKIIPSERLGQLLGRMFAFQFGGVFFSLFATGAIAKVFDEPTRYGVLFIITFFMTIIAALVISTLKEPEGEAVKSAPSFSAYIGKLFTIYKTDKLFSKFIVGKWLMSGHYIMQAFLLFFLLGVHGFNKDNSGWFPSFNALGLVIGGFTINKIADVYGPKYMLITSQIIAILYTLIFWLVPGINPVVIIAGFLITGLAQLSDNVGYSNMSLFCCPSADKSTYVAAVNIGIVLPMACLPVIAGKLWHLGIIGHNSIFAFSIVLMIAAIIYIMAVIENPKAFEDIKAAAANE